MDEKTRILIVDDDANIRELLAQVFQTKDYAPSLAANGKAALRIAVEESPVVALVDLNLGDMPGLQLIRQIRGQAPSTECIVLTGYASQTSAIEAINLGAYSYILKPFEIDHLLATVRGAVDKCRSEQALKESEERFRNIVESSPMGMHLYQLDTDGNLIFMGANPAADQILKVDNTQFIGQNIESAFPSLVDTEVPDRYRYVAKHGESWYTQQIDYQDEKIMGAFEVHAFQTTPNNMAVFFVDVTERARSEESLRQRAAQLLLLNEMGNEIATLADLNSVLNRAVDLVHENFGYHHVALFTIDSDHNDVVLRAKSGSFVHLFPDDHRLKISQGLVGWVAEFNETLLANDVSVEKHYINLFPETITTQSELSVPIQVGDEAVGVLDIQSPNKNAFDESDVIVMQTLANQIAVAIENARLHEAVQQELVERRRAETELRESEARLMTLSAATFEGIAISEQGIVIDANEQFVNILGYQRTEMIGEKVEKYVHPDDLAMVRERMVSGSEDPYEHRSIHKNGSVVNVEVRPRMMEVGGRMMRVTAVRDITERKHSEEALRRQLQESQTLAAISQALNETLDLNRILELIVDSAREVIPHVERAVIHLFEEDDQVLVPIAVSSDLEMEKHYLTMRPGVGVAGQVMDQGITINIRDTEDDPRFVSSGEREQSYMRSLLVAPVQSGDHRIGTISVSSHVVKAFSDEDDHLLTILGVQAALAIETSRLFEGTRRSLKETNALYRISNHIVASLDINVDEILQQAANMLFEDFGYYHVHVYLFDPETGLLTAQQGSGGIGQQLYEKGLKFTLEQGVVGYVAAVGDAFVANNVKDVYFYVPNPLLPETTAELAAPLRARGKLLGVLDIHHRAPNQFNSDDKRLILAVADQLAGVIDKATLYAELQEALQKEQSIRVQLIQAEKLAAMGRLVASVAHELNNPLQAIQNALYLVKMEDSLAPQARGDLQVALDETTRMGNLIARLRETYRPKTSETFEQDSLNEIAREVQKLIDTHLRHNDIQFELIADPDLPSVSMSRDQIKQVVLNLCLNAVESMSDGGKLTIRTIHQVEDENIVLEVRDTGSGIPSEIIPHIFEPFYTTKEKGTGLGLFISYEILQNHGGSIEVASNPQGTTFSIALPVDRSMI